MSSLESKSVSWILYGTLGCHLCEQAQALVFELQRHYSIELTIRDIAESEALVKVMGTRIPVLESVALGQQLDWPFDPDVITHWLSHSFE